MFSADLSWTDRNDQSNKDSRGRGRSGKGHVSSETSLPPNYKVHQSKDGESTKSSFFFRKKRPGSSRSTESSGGSSVGTGAYTSSTMQDDKFGNYSMGSPATINSTLHVEGKSQYSL
jgi:hypothetical protein